MNIPWHRSVPASNFFPHCSLTSQIDNYTGPELGELIRKHKIVNPDTGNEVDEPVQFNLMFDSSIGPTGKIKGCVSGAQDTPCI